jgi:hypothetical protein
MLNFFFPNFYVIQEHGKPIYEALTYYLCTHEKNQFLLPTIRDRAEQHVRFHQQQQQHSLLSQASWGRLTCKISYLYILFYLW